MSEKFLKEGHTVIATSLEIESLESLAEGKSSIVQIKLFSVNISLF